MAQSEFALSGTTNGPESWPQAPAEITVTTLAEIESCPRRWALSAASYPDTWEGRGYPPRVHLGGLAGTVVHLALETITRALVRAGCRGVQDPNTFQVMKSLGGHSQVVNTCIDRVLERFAGNPRAQGLLEFAARSLRGRVPELRTRTQTMLSRVRLPSVGAPQIEERTIVERGPLPMGVFAEVELRAKEIRWKGRADLLVLSPDVCGITDFKTGAPDDGHQFQIRVYALLWSRDAELNPTRRRADRLVLAYEAGEVEASAPSDAELDAIERNIVARGEAARQAVSQSPPEARPSADNCRYCGVRQLCSEYWTAKAQQKIAEQAGDARFGDAEVTITGRHGPSSWDARVELSRNLPPGMPAVFRTSSSSELQVGARLRVVDAAIVLDGEDQAEPAVITLGKLSEAYAVANA